MSTRSPTPARAQLALRTTPPGADFCRPAAKPSFTWEGRSEELIGQQLQVLQGNVTDGRDVEEAGEQMRQLGGEDAEQGHAAVQPGQRGLAP